MSSGGAPPASVYTPPDPSSSVVFHSDIFILTVTLLFSLFNVPRALVYIANDSCEVFQGYFLRSATRFRTYSSSPGMEGQSTDKAPITSITQNIESGVALRQRWHFPMGFSLRHPAASVLHYRVYENYTVLQVLLMIGYTAVVFFAAFDQTNIFTNPDRIGWVMASQIPFVYAFATKNVIGFLVGVGYEKLNFLHRHVGRLVVIGANVHVIGFIYQWSLAGTVSENLAQTYVRWGLVSLTCMDLLGLLSLHGVRMKFYNLFFGTHVLASTVLLVAVCLHQQVAIPYVIAGSVIYGLDRIVRIIKTRFTTATLQTIPELGLTRVDIPTLTTGWRAGQHVRLRILSTDMRLWGMIEAHPFTIASAASTKEGLVLMCKKTGKWTRRLYAMAQTTPGEQGSQVSRRVKVMIEGPYGGIGDIVLPNYSGAVFIVGGSGVTFALSVVQDLVLAGDRSRTRVIEVIWCIQNPAALNSFIPLFATLVSESGPATLRISVFYTRGAGHSSEIPVLQHGITLTPGRPDIGKLLGGFVASMANQAEAHGTFVATCGPVSLASDVARAVRKLDFKSKKAVGGIQFHEEVFGW